MTNGILLALLAYATYSWSDASIKALGGELSIFEIGFFQTAIAGAFILMTRPDGGTWHGFWRMRHPYAVQARALIGLVASVLSVLAFTTIPLAEVYAIVFLSPFFVTILSMVLLKEKVGPWRWFAIFAGFAGVLLVVRPGFRVLEFGHAAAVAMSMLSATSIILMRSLSARERHTTILGFLIIYGVAFNGVAMALTGVTVPTLQEWVILVLAGAFAASGHIMLLRATRFAEANKLAPTHYSQIVWAVVIGALLFNEAPDGWSLAGLGIIAGSGLLTILRERIRLGTVRWNRTSRTRL